MRQTSSLNARIARWARVAALAALIALPALLVSQSTFSGDESWIEYKKGLRALEARDLRGAVGCFTKAINDRHDWFDKRAAILDEALGNPKVKKTLDQGIDWSVKAMRAAGFDPAAGLVEDARKRYANREFRRVGELRAYLQAFREYPEAEFMLGKAFRAEGENALGLAQYLRALSHSSALETPAFAIEMRYELANLYYASKDYLSMVAQYEEILKSDPMMSGSGNDYIRTAMTRILRNSGFNRLIALYRIRYDFSMEAHFALTAFYSKVGDHQKAVEQGMIGLCMFFTKMIDRLAEEDPDYEFDGVGALMARVGGPGALGEEFGEYAKDSGLYECMYWFANALYGVTSWSAGKEVWACLAKAPDGGPWAKRAAQKLKKPGIDPPTPAP
jgi:hypothetical protein